MTFAAFAAACEHRISLDVERRPGNALNVEAGTPTPRCRLATPEEWGATDPRARRWLASGGTPLVLGCCGAAACPVFVSEMSAAAS